MLMVKILRTEQLSGIAVDHNNNTGTESTTAELDDTNWHEADAIVVISSCPHVRVDSNRRVWKIRDNTPIPKLREPD